MPDNLILIAGPCTAESEELLQETAQFLSSTCRDLPIDLYFKASFDKANRSSIHSYRGPGIEKACEWFSALKQKYKIKVLTDIHECWQVAPLQKVCDGLQIPAFLCRQTDLIIEATKSGLFVNVKKGQFISHGATQHITQKIKDTAKECGITPNFALTERGNVFGYGDLIVDMRGFAKMSEYGKVIFDITHSCQKPSEGQTTQGLRAYAALLARSAAATGYLDGLFMEVHPTPAKAKSDSETQLNFDQAKELLEQIVPLWEQSKSYRERDKVFK